MARKLIFTIVVLSFAMLELLAVRQAQINTVHSMTVLHRKIEANNEALKVLKIQIERACSPSKLAPANSLTGEADEQP
ncbi:MAG: hypothetical protein ACKVIO_01260 [Phycisphaerales bacterium]|jgi:hypothetical protein